MSFIAVDVQYTVDGSTAFAAGVSFPSIGSDRIEQERVVAINSPADYVSGKFYKREMPCILHILEMFPIVPEIIIADAYIDLGTKPGMGRYLYNALDQAIPVIGVAKTLYLAAPAVEVLRGRSKKPLYVTSAGIDIDIAANLITHMHGSHRIPTMLKRVDKLARNPGSSPSHLTPLARSSPIDVPTIVPSIDTQITTVEIVDIVK